MESVKTVAVYEFAVTIVLTLGHHGYRVTLTSGYWFTVTSARVTMDIVSSAGGDQAKTNSCLSHPRCLNKFLQPRVKTLRPCRDHPES